MKYINYSEVYIYGEVYTSKIHYFLVNQTRNCSIIKFFYKESAMKLKLLFLGVVALLLSGCMDSITAVPKAVIDGTGNIISSVWDAITFWDN